jgi:transitional endoplasmic reticulum ATPase
VTDSVVAALLSELDGVAERGEIVVIGATNRKDLIDPALLRGGRLESHIELGLPDLDARRALLDISDVPFAGDVDLGDLARRTEGMSFADLAGLLREAALVALRRDATAITVSTADLVSALERYGA